MQKPKIKAEDLPKLEDILTYLKINNELYFLPVGFPSYRNNGAIMYESIINTTDILEGESTETIQLNIDEINLLYYFEFFNIGKVFEGTKSDSYTLSSTSKLIKTFSFIEEYEKQEQEEKLRETTIKSNETAIKTSKKANYLAGWSLGVAIVAVIISALVSIWIYYDGKDKEFDLKNRIEKLEKIINQPKKLK